MSKRAKVVASIFIFVMIFSAILGAIYGISRAQGDIEALNQERLDLLIEAGKQETYDA